MLEVLLNPQRSVACSHPAEVALLLRQVSPYFKHGVCLRPGDTVFDVGANIGLFCALAGDWGGRALTGFAFEPAPALLEPLRINLSRYAPGVVPVASAVSGEVGSLTLSYFARATMLSTAFADDLSSAATRHAVADQLRQLPRGLRWLSRLPRGLRRALVNVAMRLYLRPTQVRCAATTLSSVIESEQVQRIDLLKIDAERAELAVLQGITAAHWPRIAQVVMEVHDIDGRLARICSLLRDQGFDHLVVEQGASLRAFGVHQLWARRLGALVPPRMDHPQAAPLA